MDFLDKLLAELQGEYTEPATPQQSPPQRKTFIQPPPKSTSLIDNILAQVKADFVEKDTAEEFRRQQELEQERIKQEQLKAQKLEGLKNQAEDWLKKLDPFSAEGLWFERFAEGYSSKLEAAIEYLQTNE
ncbi:hypothetical protein OGM63_15460 [Plectonema radiosum NIES-515]|uniref:ATPase n=1 Tax=Plectonema radiosum NIES-515 TaxID=2986073 RepID=A0ABT3B0I3_9CYAN|nr:hypothetical protein [Plectonema radiosum]MCV3214895.1 hypothetical protein [Plectonema radiosum NIES-515]